MFKFLGNKLRSLFRGKIDDESFEKLEELFYQADLGNATSIELAELSKKLYKREKGVEEILDQIKEFLYRQLISIPPRQGPDVSPNVSLIVGVNGNGKTTTVAKLAHYHIKQNKKVIIAAADTFRAAATDQIERWSKRIGCELVRGLHGSDPAAVVFDTLEAAKSRGYDNVFIDTAGRLHTKRDLMQELEKICRVCNKSIPGAPHEILLILDATVGQNGIEQASTFNSFTPLTGLVLTKMDGTAKGGTAFAIQKALRLPIKYIGFGEGLDDFSIFNPKEFVQSLFSEN